MDDAAILILRIVLGTVIISHGVHKFQKKELNDRKWQEDYGFPRGSVLLTGILQISGGLAIFAGVYSRIAALVLFPVMLMATYISIGKHHEPFLSSPDGKGWDINLLLTGSLIALIFLGDGRWALARW